MYTESPGGQDFHEQSFASLQGSMYIYLLGSAVTQTTLV